MHKKRVRVPQNQCILRCHCVFCLRTEELTNYKPNPPNEFLCVIGLLSSIDVWLICRYFVAQSSAQPSRAGRHWAVPLFTLVEFPFTWWNFQEQILPRPETESFQLHRHSAQRTCGILFASSGNPSTSTARSRAFFLPLAFMSASRAQWYWKVNALLFKLYIFNKA